MQIDAILRLAFKVGASDVHLTVGAAPALRLHGSLLPLDAPEWERLVPGDALPELSPLSPEDTEAVARAIMTEEQYGRFRAQGEVDFGYELPGVGRFRVNAFRRRGSAALVLRLINTRIPGFRELGLPEVLPQLARRPNGLILVTGPTGSGKSTTLAAMIDLINSERRCHIITLEDPIEYVHMHKKSLVNQREIGSDSPSFASALRVALREDPDVILVGEMRDPETIAIAITAAETGHLVMSTLHTSSA
ncbi:MAG: PilT/PilU family type 4a pilus ATPase, partial [Firmicutes bacterium]|nr:PilT/PilU family type 4a pilus ATPase [Bacillota bacterium]